MVAYNGKVEDQRLDTRHSRVPIIDDEAFDMTSGASKCPLHHIVMGGLGANTL